MQEIDLGEILNSKVVTDFRHIYRRFTGLTTSLYFPSWNSDLGHWLPREGPSRFCRIIHSYPEILEMCREDDKQMLTCVQADRKASVSRCFLGVCGINVPVFFGDKWQGVACAGDFFTRKPSEEQFRKAYNALSPFGFDRARLRSAYFEIPVMPRGSVEAALDLLSLIVNYIVDREHIINLQEELFLKQNEVTDSLRARMDVQKDLQQTMDEVMALRKRLVVAMSGDKGATLLDSGGMKRKKVVEDILHYIDEHYAEDITLADLAQYTSLSRTYLSALFHKECGCTFAEYLVMKRIGKACELLQDHQYSASQVAVSVGYESISHFNRTFKRIMGVTPGRYQDRISVGQDSSGSSD